ncbi:2-amino-4-hydroxy-6-hydroxymethyldihydropteridine diphosphokinase [Jannaschia sp. M317]|uniref:2-amino-4-hydroxy-6- hydroxymethyldihydropteridine diphosphokinase n=1 Tax=Jannaschia sp. M317 TaxID=2867011 RepID=UPI0021A608D5|nr:2-amino-4-hydroxy-6-hydroxymethyldihydropteridine diphosphokinase [Jannaschia sp. M317]UWQ17397.1 2-amino-4-hydroxy-6-hydroxymethyldihydropteridine diphosphokinase [Jannaschia sp. M317]
MILHLIALGANSGGSRATNARTLARAAGVLRTTFGPGLRLSDAFATPAWPPGIGPDFVNAAGCFRSALSPGQVLARLHRIEARFGRIRTRRWAARSLDLDLLASSAMVRPDNVTARAWIALDPGCQAQRVPDRLILPHPRMQDRGFVLLPLAQVAPGWRHPLTGRRVADMAAALPPAARRGIAKLGPI